MLNQSFFNFKQRLVLNSNKLDMSPVGLNISKIDKYFHYAFKIEPTKNVWNNPNCSLIKTKSLDLDFVNFNCNFKITRAKFNSNPLICIFDETKNYDIFKTIVFFCYPLYSCIQLKENHFIYKRIEEYFIAECLKDISNIFHLPEMSNINLTALFLMSLCLDLDNHYEYKNFIRSWHIQKGIPIPYFLITQPLHQDDALKLYTFFVLWVEFFYNGDKISLKKCSDIKMCTQTLIEEYTVNINRISDTFFFSKELDKPYLKIFKLGFETDFNYYIYYKCNKSFSLQFSNPSNLNQMYTVETSKYQNTIEIPKRKEDNILIIKIFTDKSFTGHIHIDQKKNDIALNQFNNYSTMLYIDVKEKISQSIVFMDGALISNFPKLEKSNKISSINVREETLNFSQYNGFQYYEVRHEQNLCLFISSNRFEFFRYFKFYDTNRHLIELDNKTDCRTTLFPLGEISDLSELDISQISFLESNGIVNDGKSPSLSDDLFPEIITDSRRLSSVQIKNFIVSHQDIINKIEDYWICLKLGSKLNKAFTDIPNFDLIDQPSSEIEIIDDSKNNINKILASNINLNNNNQNTLLENLFYISFNTRLTLDLQFEQVFLKPKNNELSMLSIKGTLLDVENLIGSCCVYLTSFNLTNGPFMKCIHESKIVNSMFNTGRLQITYKDHHSLKIANEIYQLPFEIKELYFFVKLYFKKAGELYCIYCFHIPIKFI